MPRGGPPAFEHRASDHQLDLLADAARAGEQYQRAQKRRNRAVRAALDVGVPVRVLVEQARMPQKTIRRLRDRLPVYGSDIEPACNLPNPK